MKKLFSLVGPEGLLVLAVAAILRAGAPVETVAAFGPFYAYAVASAAVLISWRFHRSRLLLALLVLVLADRALAPLAAAEALRAGPGAVVFQGVAVLLPANLVLLALLPERGALSPAGLVRMALIASQAGLLAFLALPEQAAHAALLSRPLLATELFAWTPVGQPALLAFAIAALLLGAQLLRTGRLGRSFFWALVASFLGVNAELGGPEPTILFATAVLAMVVAVIEASYVMAYQDGLTGLPGRRALNEALQRLGSRYAVAMVDVDHFKKFNDRYGHDIGDQVLRMVAAQLAEVGGGGRAFRYGGEEFALVFPGKTALECLPHVEELREAVAGHGFTLRGLRRPRRKPPQPTKTRGKRKSIAITISAGVAERTDRNPTPEEVIKAADKSLYRAKKAGRNRVMA